MAVVHVTLKSRRGQDQQEVDQDQEEVDQDFARPRSAGIDESRVQDQEVDRLIKVSRNKAQEAMSIPMPS